MRKVYQLRDLDCANCAAKMENRIRKLEGVKEANVSFMTQRLVLVTEKENQKELVEEIRKVIKRIDPNCDIVG